MSVSYGCSGCETTAGPGACPVHGQQIKIYPISPNIMGPLPPDERDGQIAQLLAENAWLARENHDIVARWELLGEEKRKLDLQVGQLQKDKEALIEQRDKAYGCYDRALDAAHHAERLIDEARKRADKAWREFDHGEECPVSQDTEDDERKANCECSTGEIEAILDILNKTEKRVDAVPNAEPARDWKCAKCGKISQFKDGLCWDCFGGDPGQ